MDVLTAERALNQAHNTYMEAGLQWQAAAIELIEAKVLERFPTATYAEVTAILDESYTEHGIRVFDGERNELTEDVDFPDDLEDFGGWWMLASEGAVFAEGEFTTIHISGEEAR